MTRYLKQINLLIIFLFCSFKLFSLPFVNQNYNYFVDLPEGYQIEEIDENFTSMMFSHPNIPVSFVMKIYEDKKSDSKTILTNALTKLNANFMIDNFSWQGLKTSISDFTMSLDKKYAGWSLCVPLEKKDSYLVMLCYTDEKNKQNCEQFILSSLNSLIINNNIYEGPIVSYAFPKGQKQEINLQIGKSKIKTHIDKNDAEASQFLIDMEFGVFSLYVNHPLWKEAWQRYYRQIYCDSFSRLDKAATDIIVQLKKDCKKTNNIELEIGRELLAWVQSFYYSRNVENKFSSDFSPLPTIFLGAGSDCDSRSMLLCLFAKKMGIESILLISREYKHAIAAVEFDAQGQKYSPPESDREFLLGETTADVTWGVIAQDHADRSKWIPVYLP